MLAKSVYGLRPTISIKKNKKPDMPQCEMLCDKKLHSKLDNYELTKFLNTHSTNLIVGKPGSGKTSMLYSFMKSKKLLAKDTLYSPSGIIDQST